MLTVTVCMMDMVVTVAMAGVDTVDMAGEVMADIVDMVDMVDMDTVGEKNELLPIKDSQNRYRNMKCLMS